MLLRRAMILQANSHDVSLVMNIIAAGNFNCSVLTIWCGGGDTLIENGLFTRTFTREPLQRAHLERRLLKKSPIAGDETSRGRNPENGRRRDFGRRQQHRQSGVQHTDGPQPSSPELLNKDHGKCCSSFLIRFDFHTSVIFTNDLNKLEEFVPNRSVCTVGGGIDGGGSTC